MSLSQFSLTLLSQTEIRGRRKGQHDRQGEGHTHTDLRKIRGGRDRAGMTGRVTTQPSISHRSNQTV